jgi:hypothetical protein
MPGLAPTCWLTGFIGPLSGLHGPGGLSAGLAYTPFLQPLPIAEAAWLIVPLVLAIAVVYKALKLPDLRELPRQSLWMSVQLIGFMALAAMVLWVCDVMLL